MSEELIPEEGELVLVTINQLSPHGAYVSLDEYEDMRGFLHISEVSTGRIRHLERFVRVGQKEVLKVIRVNKARREVDLSLKQVTGQEKKDKLIDVKQFDKAKSILEIVKNRLNLTEQDSKKYSNILQEKFGILYGALEEAMKLGVDTLSDLDLPASYKATVVEVAKEKIVPPTVEIKGVLEISSTLRNSIEIIKEGLMAAEKVATLGAKVEVSYISAPKYRLTVQAENYKVAEKLLVKAVEAVKDTVKNKAVVNFQKSKSSS